MYHFLFSIQRGKTNVYARRLPCSKQLIIDIRVFSKFIHIYLPLHTILIWSLERKYWLNIKIKIKYNNKIVAFYFPVIRIGMAEKDCVQSNLIDCSYQFGLFFFFFAQMLLQRADQSNDIRFMDKWFKFQLKFF